MGTTFLLKSAVTILLRKVTQSHSMSAPPLLKLYFVQEKVTLLWDKVVISKVTVEVKTGLFYKGLVLRKGLISKSITPRLN